jgi:hypothetical protein
MKGVTHIWAVLTEVFFALSLVDVMLEWCLIRLLRQRHHELWVKAGSPRVSLWGYVPNSAFNGKQFVRSQADRLYHDPLLSVYCWVYRIFNMIFIGFLWCWCWLLSRPSLPLHGPFFSTNDVANSRVSPPSDAN